MYVLGEASLEFSTSWTSDGRGIRARVERPPEAGASSSSADCPEFDVPIGARPRHEIPYMVQHFPQDEVWALRWELLPAPRLFTFPPTRCSPPRKGTLGAK